MTKTMNDTRRRKETDDKETPKPATKKTTQEQYDTAVYSYELLASTTSCRQQSTDRRDRDQLAPRNHVNSIPASSLDGGATAAGDQGKANAHKGRTDCRLRFAIQ